METFLGSFHPAVVHIPIGLLLVASLLEMALFFVVSKRTQFEYTLMFMYVVGVLGALFALQTGEALEHAPDFPRQVVEVHSFFASATTAVYAVLAGGYVYRVLAGKSCWMNMIKKSTFGEHVWQYIGLLATVVMNRWVRAVLALVACILLAMTGALGGAIAHGPDADMLTSFVYSLFF